MVRRNNISNLFVGLYFIVILYHYIYANIIPVVLISGMLTGISLIGKIKGRNALIFTLLFVLIIWALIISRFNNNVTNLPLLLIPGYFIALNIKYNLVWDKLFIALFYLFFLYVLFQSIQGAHFNDLLDRTSRNGVGAILLIFLITHYIICIYKNTNLILSHAFLVLFISIYLYGRANIIIAVLLLVGLIFYKFPQYDRKLKIATFIVAGALAFAFIEYYQPYSDTIEVANRFEEKGFESNEREIVLFGYLDKINFITFLSGVSVNQHPFQILDGNLHNSYLRAHSFFGILSLAIFYMLIIAIKKMNMYSFLLGLILLRVFTDTLFFVGVFDYLWILVYLLQSENKLITK